MSDKYSVEFENYYCIVSVEVIRFSFWYNQSTPSLCSGKETLQQNQKKCTSVKNL